MAEPIIVNFICFVYNRRQSVGWGHGNAVTTSDPVSWLIKMKEKNLAYNVAVTDFLEMEVTPRRLEEWTNKIPEYANLSGIPSKR